MLWTRLQRSEDWRRTYGYVEARLGRFSDREITDAAYSLLPDTILGHMSPQTLFT